MKLLHDQWKGSTASSIIQGFITRSKRSDARCQSGPPRPWQDEHYRKNGRWYWKTNLSSESIFTIVHCRSKLQISICIRIHAAQVLYIHIYASSDFTGTYHILELFERMLRVCDLAITSSSIVHTSSPSYLYVVILHNVGLQAYHMTVYSICVLFDIKSYTIRDLHSAHKRNFPYIIG